MDALPTLLFIDHCCPKPYHPGQLAGCGGTEGTLIEVAEALAATGYYNVVVEQHNRLESETYKSKATYAHPGYATEAKWVVVLRDPRPMVAARLRFPRSRIYLYSHDLADRSLGILYQFGAFKESGCLANICVSAWHKTQTIETLKVFGFTGEFRTKFIYNPIAEYAVKDDTPYDRNKLVWLASPHKGLAQAYTIFKWLLQQNPDFRLYVTNPGYMETQYSDDQEVKNRVVVLGTVSHLEAVEHLRSSLCLFYPNTVFPETFGKIMAEANAVGTPVITSPIGASYEVLDRHPEQLMDCRDVEGVVKRVMKWYSGARPFVRGNPKFKMVNVVAEWVKLLNDLR